MSENPFFSAFFEGFKPARQRERAALTLFRALEAKQDGFLQPGGGSADTPARAPRRTRTTSRKPSSDGGEDGDGDGPEPRYSISATAHEGFSVRTKDGRSARLCVVGDDGEVLSDDVCGDAFKVAVAAYRQFLQGTGHLRVHASAPGLAKA
jgi:hypothetical protein